MLFINILLENVNFQLLFVVVKMTERRKNQSEEWTYFTLLFIYFITVNKYRFCISVIEYINVQTIGYINVQISKPVLVIKNKYWSITSIQYIYIYIYIYI